MCSLKGKNKNGVCRGKNVWKFSRCNPWNVHQKILRCQNIPIKEGSHLPNCEKKKETGFCMRRKLCYMGKFLTLLPAYLRGTVKDTNNWKKIIF